MDKAENTARRLRREIGELERRRTGLAAQCRLLEELSAELERQSGGGDAATREKEP